MRTLLPVLIFVIILSILVGGVIYLSQRLAWSFGMGNPRILYLVFGALIPFMIGGLIAFSNSAGIAGSTIYRTMAMILGFLLYLLLSVLLMHLVSLFVHFKPASFGFVSLILAVLVSGIGFLNSYRIRVTRLDIPLKGLQKEVSAVHLSDIHMGHFRGVSFLQKVIDRTNGLEPDVVFLTGDLYDGKAKLSLENTALLKQIHAPVFFVNGNHDRYTGVETIKLFLRETGVRVLENETATFNGLTIVGLNHMRAEPNKADMHSAPGGASIRETLEGMEIDGQRPVVLLHHSPDGIEYASQKGVDLYLSGHTHAGQLFPVNYINDLLFKYNKGLHRYKETLILVSQGIGTFGPPMRIGTRSEIISLKLQPEP